MSPDRGMIQSFDLLFCVLVALMTMHFFLLFLQFQLHGIEENQANWKQTRIAHAVLDSLVKNHNPDQPVLGSARLDTERHRVISNEIDPVLLNRIAFRPNGMSFTVRQLAIRFFDGQTQFLIAEQTPQKDCRPVERVITIHGKKGILFAEICF
ncbi:MAG: hypothetical protein J4215_01135 [Candidatus Diapherotrites archaeon]|uniref:Uncharacterized protein n=1 Tax=Candidatus Iainarchaeum sp. TaxID=3101447 RepID=A0A8T4L1F4_9ARCH|nr:hypothetical protein [Candidatus Diapherotrites archaeon]